MIRHHVSQRTRTVVVAPAAFHADRLGGGNLHVIDVAAVPDRLEDAVAEAERQDVLNGFLAEVVVDPIELRLIEHGEQVAVERPCGIEVVSERLLHHHPAPAVALLGRQAGVSELAYRFGEEIRRGRQIVQNIAAGAVVLVDGSDP